MEKSSDDDYLFHILVMNERINDVGEMQVSKLMRAFERRPALVRSLMAAATPVARFDAHSGALSQTAAFTADSERLDRALTQIGKALHFHHWGEKCAEIKGVLVEFATFEYGSVRKRALRRISECSDELFVAAPALGDNPDVFFYQARQAEDDRRVMRLTFYGASKVTLMF